MRAHRANIIDSNAIFAIVVGVIHSGIYCVHVPVYCIVIFPGFEDMCNRLDGKRAIKTLAEHVCRTGIAHSVARRVKT